MPAIRLLAPNDKHPGAVADYSLSWADFLRTGETIASATVTVPGGITLDSNSVAGTSVLFRLSGGTAGTTYIVVVTITTSVGQVEPAEIEITVTDPTP
jgi:hypothetical protein